MAAIYTPDREVACVLLDKMENGMMKGASHGMKEEEEEERDGESVGEEEGGERRDQWGSQMEFLLSTVGYCVGVGNIFRFPYICNQNGGGAFLLPFLICLMLIGMPMFFMETALGQFRGKSPLHVWSVCPLLKGIGITTGILAAIVFWYYDVILAWSLYYLVMSFRSTLPWTLCGQWWNTDRCTSFHTRDHDDHSSPSNATTSPNMTSPDPVTSRPGMTSLNETVVAYAVNASAGFNGSINGTMTRANVSHSPKMITAAEEFWQHNVLQISTGLYDTGDIVWYLAIAQIVVVIFLFLALFKGIKSSGKVVYVTATAPYVLLTVLLIRSVTLPGAGQGMLFYITPDFTKLADYNIWIQAALQVFYSLAVAWGICQTLSSFNKFNNNVMRDSLIITLIGEGTSIYAGFAVFSVLGYLAQQSGQPVDQVVSSGPGLAFVVYPEALSMMPLSQLWAVLFFLMLVTVVFDTQMATGETLFTILSDQFPKTLRRHGLLVRGVTSLLVLLFSLLLVSQSGIYVFQLVDWYIGSYTTTVIALLECIVIGWVYGADRFGEDIQLMIGRKPPMIIKILWCFILPVFFSVLLVVTVTTYQSPVYGDYRYDTLAAVLGWLIAVVPFLPIPLVAIYQVFRAEGTLLQRLKQASRPDEHWGPADSRLFPTYRAKMMKPLPRESCLDIVRN